MEVFNIHLFELLLIAGVALVIFGPERLPELGRFAGKQIARFLAWQQQSPELQLVNELRNEFEQEIAGLRDELVRTRKQLDLSTDTGTIREELRSMVSLRDEVLSLREQPALPPAPALADEASPLSTAELLDPVPASELPNIVTVDLPDSPAPAAPGTPELTIKSASGSVPMTPPNRIATNQTTAVLNTIAPHEYVEASIAPPEAVHRPVQPEQAALAMPTMSAPPVLNGQAPSLSAAEQAYLLHRIETLSAELQALVAALQRYGVLGDDWQAALISSSQEAVAQ